MTFAVLQHRALDLAAGALLQNVDIRVRRELPGLPSVQLYADAQGDTPIGNPTVGGHFTDGKIRAYCAGGFYRVELLVSGVVVDTFYDVAVGLAAGVDVPPEVREKLSANRTLFVRTDGSDSNAGLVNNAGGAFLTPQKAIDAAAALDSSIYDVTIQCGNGTYNTGTGLIAKTMVGAGSIIIVGDETTPSNVIFNCNSSDGIALFSLAVSTIYEIRGVKITASGGGTTYGPRAAKGSYVKFRAIDIGAGWGQQLRAEDYGVLEATGNFTHSAGAANGAWVTVDGEIRVQGRTVTISNTPNFAGSGFASASSMGFIIATGNTFVGSATGVRYTAATNSVIQTNGAGPTHFPGNSAGSTATGAQYT